MPRQNIMAFAPVKLIMLAVLLVQVASVIAVPAFGGFAGLDDYGGALGVDFGAPADDYYIGHDGDDEYGEYED